jgi:glycosyltransferase involved in cell wall biosynthesis
MNVFLSVIIPFYNEEDGLIFCYEELNRVFNNYSQTVEFIFIDDGSKDQSYSIIEEISKKDSRVKCIQFSRNFGKEAAMSAGFKFSTGQFVCQIDADLQDPPELLPEMISYAQNNNFDVVYGVRKKREGETVLKKITSFLFYKVIRKMSVISIPEHTGDFRIMTREVVDALCQLTETQRFMKGLFAWVGFRQAPFYYLRKPRKAGKTKFNYLKLWNFAVEGITSFSDTPLRFATAVGFFISCFAFLLSLFYIAKYFIYGDAIQGFLTLIVAILFIGGIQLMFLGIIGEYLGRVYFESKGRPLFIIRQKNSNIIKD